MKSMLSASDFPDLAKDAKRSAQEQLASDWMKPLRLMPNRKIVGYWSIIGIMPQ